MSDYTAEPEPGVSPKKSEDHITVARTAKPFVNSDVQSAPAGGDVPSRLRKEEEEDFIDTIALAGAAVTETASNAAYRIQEAMEQGSLWEVDAAVVDFSGKIIQLADHVAQKGLGSGIGCSHDPVELHHSSLAALNEGLAGLSASVEAAVDAVSSHFVTTTVSEGASQPSSPAVSGLHPKVGSIVEKAEKATAKIGETVQSVVNTAFVVDDNQVPETVLRRGDAAVAVYRKRAAEAAARATSPRVEASSEGAAPGTPMTPSSAKSASAAAEGLPPRQPKSPSGGAGSSGQPREGETPASPSAAAADAEARKAAEPASPAARAAPPAEAPRPSAALEPAGAVSSGESSSSGATQGSGGVRSALNGAACILTPLQQLAAASKHVAAAASKNIAESRSAVESRLQASVKNWASLLPSNGAAAVAALEKLKLPIHQELPQSLQDGPLDGSAAQDTEAVVDALRDKGHQAAATGDAVSAVRLYTAALALAPENHLLRYSRANALLQLGKTKEATRDALVLVKVMPVWSNGWGLCAKLMEADGNFQEAVALYQCAKQIAENEDDDAAVQKYEDAIERVQERGSQLDRP